MTATSISRIVVVAALALAGASGFADQTVEEKANAAGRDAKRTMKKKVHRAEESLCAEGDAKCLQKKAKHRAHESKDYVEDKAKEVKDKAD